MKTKHSLIFTIATAGICAVLRIMQYCFIIDQNGYFRPESTAHTMLIYILYAVMALAAVTALIIMFVGSRERVGAEVFKNNSSGFLMLGAAVLMTVDFGICAGKMFQTSVPDIAALFELLTAIYFAVLGYKILSGSRIGGAAVIGIFAPIFVIVFAVTEFFGSFEKVHVSETKFNMLAICAMALFVVTVTLLFAGNAVSKKRLTAVCMLYTVIASPAAVAGLAALIAGKITAESPVRFTVKALTEIVFMALAITAMARTDRCILSTDKEETQNEAESNSETAGENLTDIISDITNDNNKGEDCNG